MTTRQRIPVFFCILALAAFATVAFADSAPDRDGNRLVVIGENGDHATVTLDGTHLQVVSVEDGDVAVHEFDMSMLAGIIDEAVDAAMLSVDAALEALDDEDITISMGEDDDLMIAIGDEIRRLDLDELAEDLEDGLDAIMAELEREFDDLDGVLVIDGQDDATEELEAEIDDLRAEIERLREDLTKLR